MDYIKPLTPSIRKDISVAFDKQIEELKTCKPNGIVNMQIECLRMYKRIITRLPDGYPIPINRKDE